MTTGELKGRLYDIGRELQQTEGALRALKRQVVALADGIRTDEGEFDLLNLATAAQKLRRVSEQVGEQYATLQRLTAERREIEADIRHREVL